MSSVRVCMRTPLRRPTSKHAGANYEQRSYAATPQVCLRLPGDEQNEGFGRVGKRPSREEMPDIVQVREEAEFPKSAEEEEAQHEIYPRSAQLPTKSAGKVVRECQVWQLVVPGIKHRGVQAGNIGKILCELNKTIAKAPARHRWSRAASPRSCDAQCRPVKVFYDITKRMGRKPHILIGAVNAIGRMVYRSGMEMYISSAKRITRLTKSSSASSLHLRNTSVLCASHKSASSATLNVCPPASAKYEVFVAAYACG